MTDSARALIGSRPRAKCAGISARLENLFECCSILFGRPEQHGDLVKDNAG